MSKMVQIFTEESCMSYRWILFNFEIIGPYWGHVSAILGPCFAILGPCFGYFCNIFTSRCLKWLKFLLKSHACQIAEYSLMFNYLDHIGTMFWQYLGPCFDYFYNIFASRYLIWHKYSLKSHAWPSKRILFYVRLFRPYQGHVLAIFRPCLAISTISLLVDA